VLRRRSLADGLGLPADQDAWLILRDLRSGREWLRDCAGIHERGLDLELKAYECRVFLDPVVVHDGPTGDHARLAARLGGTSVASVEEALRDLVREPARQAIGSVLDEGAFRRLAGVALDRDEVAAQRTLDREAVRLAASLTELGRAVGGTHEHTDAAARALERRLRRLSDLARAGRRSDAPAAATMVAGWLSSDRVRWLALPAWAYLDTLRRTLGIEQEDAASVDTWQIEPLLQRAAAALGLDTDATTRGIGLARALAALPDEPADLEDDGHDADQILGSGPWSAAIPAKWLSDPSIRSYLGINQWQDETYVERDAFESFVDTLAVRDVLDATDVEEGRAAQGLVTAQELKARVAAAGWRVSPSGQREGEE